MGEYIDLLLRSLLFFCCHVLVKWFLQSSFLFVLAFEISFGGFLFFSRTKFWLFFSSLYIQSTTLRLREKQKINPELLSAGHDSTFQNLIYLASVYHLERVLFSLACVIVPPPAISVFFSGGQKYAFRHHQHISASVHSFPVFALMGSTTTRHILWRHW